MTADVTVPAETVHPARRRAPAFGLSWRILALVVTAVMTAEVLIFLPSIARFREVYLEQLIESGTLKALAVTGDKRFETLPDVPTAIEAGLPGYTASAWYGLVGPKGMPAEVKAKLETATAETLGDTEVLDKLKNDGAVASSMGAQAFADFMATERARWGEVVKAADIKME